MYGNIWYMFTNLNDGSGNTINTATFAVSLDGGVTFSVVETIPTDTPPSFYDYPQFCFGGNGLGGYGINFVVDSFDPLTNDFTPTVGFIPINGFNSFGAASITTLPNLTNVNILADVTASLDGRVWFQGIPWEAGSYIAPVGLIFKSPGALDENYAGAWNTVICNLIAQEWDISVQDSQPVRGYIPQSVQSLLYDDARQALYAICSAQFSDYSQNARIYFLISRDNGQTWSKSLDLSTTDFANRGFQSMALDTVTGNLIFGWYDGRNDRTFQSVEYYGAVIPADKLDELVLQNTSFQSLILFTSQSLIPTSNRRTTSVD